MTAEHPKPSPDATEVFHEDFVIVARHVQRVLVGYVIFIAVIILGDLVDPEDPMAILTLAMLLTLFAALTEIFIARAKRNIPVLALNASGICFPQLNYGPIAWNEITRIRVIHTHGRAGLITALRFHVRKGVIPAQWGGRPNQFDVTLAMNIFRRSKHGQILGGMNAMLDSIEQFHPVERP